MTTVLDEPADLLKLVGQPVGTTEWMKLTQPQVDLFAHATGFHQWIHTEPQRRQGPVQGERRLRIPHAVAPRGDLAGAADPGTDGGVENYGLNKARFPAPVRVGSRIRATVTLMSAQQKTSGVESVFTLSYEIDGEPRPACVADVIVLYP